MFLAVADNFAICSGFIDDLACLDQTLAYLADDTAENYDTDLYVFPLADVCKSIDDARRISEEGLT